MNDELMRLWHCGTEQQPDPEEIARLAARATITRFDRTVFWRNFREYAAGLGVMALFGWLALSGDQPVPYSIAFVSVGFVMAYLWWQHRGLQPLDPATDARSYQSAMLARIDHQIRLLRTVRYWYLAPLAIPPLLQLAEAARRGHWLTAALGLAIVAVIYWGLAVLNERTAVGLLSGERKRVENLYREDG